jgi:hypothetical protein
MGARKLRYSERKAIAEKGNLGPLEDAASPQLQAALIHLIGQGEEAKTGYAFKPALRDAAIRHFGLVPAEAHPASIILDRSTEDLLDFIEIVCETASKKYAVYAPGLARPAAPSYARPLPNVQGEMNDLFDRHRFGYRLEGGEIRKIGSPALDETVVGPALLGVQREGWEEVERSFKEAIQHQRGPQSENDDALTAANAAVEAALKAAGFKGANLGPLSKDFKNSQLIPAELRGVPEALDVLLKRTAAIRNARGDSHGKSPGAEAVPQELVDLAIHWAGAFIVYLGQAVPED